MVTRKASEKRENVVCRGQKTQKEKKIVVMFKFLF